MKIKVTSPNDLEVENNQLLEDIITQLEHELITVKLIHGEYKVKICKEVSDINCMKISEIYQNAGWSSTLCNCIKSQGRYNEIDHTTTLTLKK